MACEYNGSGERRGEMVLRSLFAQQVGRVGQAERPGPLVAGRRLADVGAGMEGCAGCVLRQITVSPGVEGFGCVFRTMKSYTREDLQNLESGT